MSITVGPRLAGGRVSGVMPGVMAAIAADLFSQLWGLCTHHDVGYVCRLWPGQRSRYSIRSLPTAFADVDVALGLDPCKVMFLRLCFFSRQFWLFRSQMQPVLGWFMFGRKRRIGQKRKGQRSATVRKKLAKPTPQGNILLTLAPLS